MQKEIWKDITGYEGHYQVSTLGRVKSLDRIIVTLTGSRTYQSKILKPVSDKDGYQRITFNGDRCPFVHRLIIEAFLGYSELHVNHKNGIKTDNRIENLEYVTSLRNINHRYRDLKKQDKYGCHYVKRLRKWRASIRVGRHSKHLGVFWDKEDAHDVFYLAYFVTYGVAPW